jgi:hypothetical protein
MMRRFAVKAGLGIGLLSLLVLLTPPAPAEAAEDVIVPIPPGWAMDRRAGSIHGQRLILAIHGIRKGNITKLVQIDGDRTIYTDVSGWCTWLDLTPDGKHILATYAERRGGAPGPIRFHLIDAEGKVVWDSNENYRPRFSTTGALFHRVVPTPSGSPNLELYGLDGKLMTKHELRRPLDDLIVVGSGDEIIALYKPQGSGPAILERSSLGDGVGSGFRIEIDPRTMARPSLRQIDHETLLIEHVSGFTTVDFNGRMYRLQPEALAAEDPERDVEFYRALKPHQGPRSGTLLLEGEYSTLLLDIATGEIKTSDVRLNSYFPWRVRDRKMLIFRPTDVIIRPLSGGD